MMDDVSEDLAILYRAVSRREGRGVYAGCITAREALRLVQLGVARLVDVRGGEERDRPPTEAPALSGALVLSLPRPSAGSPVHDLGEALRALGASTTDTLLFIAGRPLESQVAATLAARAGFHCALHVLDERERYRGLCEPLAA
jgi:hypothetical protein